MITVITHSPEETELLPPSSEDSGYPKTAASDETDQAIDEAIIWAFGHALIQHEATLFHKTRRILPGTRVNPDAFRAHLERMETRGYLRECQLEGMRCWRRLVDDPYSTGELPSW